MKLRSRVLLLIAGVILLVLVGSLGLVQHNLKSDILARVEGELSRSAANFKSRENQEFTLLTSLATTLEGNPSLRLMVNRTNRPTVEDFLEEVRLESGVDFIVLTDREGRPNFTTEGSPVKDEPLSLRSVESALEGTEERDYWAVPEGVFRVFTLPMAYQGMVSGTLSMGIRLDRQKLRTLGDEMGVELALVQGQEVLETSTELPPVLRESKGLVAERYQARSLDLAGETRLLLLLDVFPFEALLAETRWQLGALGLAIFLAALALSVPLAGRVAVPAELLETVVETVGEGLCHLDQEGRVVLMNPEAERLLELQPQSGKGRLLLEEFTFRADEEAPPLKLEDMKKVVRILDGLATTPSREFPLSLATTPIHSEQEEPAGAVVVFRDITELKNNERKLQDAQAQAAHASKLAAVGQLAAGVAHELNTPLGAVQLQLEGALRRPEKTDRVKKKLEASLGALEGMRKIVSSLLSHSVNAPAGQKREADLAEVVGDTMTLLGPQMDKAGVRLETDLTPQVKVRIPAPELQQILINLLTNARDAVLSEGARGTTIKVAVELEDERGILRVCDQGPGIPEHVRSRLFDPFFTTKPVGKGTGLGLSVTKSLLDQNEAEVKVSSAPGEDTVFEVGFALVKQT